MGNNELFIRYESEDFPHSSGMGQLGRLTLTWDDILWAALTVGRPNRYYVFRHGAASGFEAIFRWSLVRMALEQRGHGLYRTDAFKSLDPTEKGAVSYFLGMVFCKLFAHKLLATPWLLHLDVFRDCLNPRVFAGRSRPDLVGQETNTERWHAFESKGRSSVLNTGEKDRAKAQAERLVSIKGRRVVLHIGAITYFKKDRLRFYWRDPEPEESEKFKPLMLELPTDVWGNYYEPVSTFLRDRGGPARETAENRDGGPVMTIIEESNVEVGAHPRIRPHLRKRNWEAARGVSRDSAEVFQGDGYRADGLVVRAGSSWQQPNGE